MNPIIQIAWTKCPICGDCDMEKTTETSGCESFSLIHCTNHACASNGGNNYDELAKTIEKNLPAKLELLAKLKKELENDIDRI